MLNLVLMLTAWPSASKEITYLSSDDFLQRAFNGDTVSPKAIWLKGKLKTDVSKILGHDYPALRVRYWMKNNRMAWILEEIGREKPLTAGFVVDKQQIVMARLLIFRESRGDEIRFPAFTEQFNGARLDETNKLDRRIDGISGATLSVNAMRKLSTIALLLSNQVLQKK